MELPSVLKTPPPSHRRIFTNRTLNLRAIKAIGYDMDYTLVHYRVEPWERRAYDEIRARLVEQGLPAADLEFDPELVVRGLVIDTEHGNLVKANRFGYVTRAFHGTKPIEFEVQRKIYGRTLVDLAETRYSFLNTLFSLSEACMFAQLVDRLDAGVFSHPTGYAGLHRLVRQVTDAAHIEGHLKAEITAHPDRYIEPDAELALALIDQREAGKKLLLITNSDWPYTRRILDVALTPYLPSGLTWRELFHLVIVSARKPDFFTSRMPLFEIATEDGLLRPCVSGFHEGGLFVGGDAAAVEQFLGVVGEEILYVGDHIFTDVHVSKSIMRWRTALILRELEDELAATEVFASSERRLIDLMAEKIRLEYEISRVRLAQQRRATGYGPTLDAREGELRDLITAMRARLVALDEKVAPLAKQAGELLNPRWGLLMRAGNDKSHLARQIEGYADIYTSRVSNFLHETPYAYLRAPRGSLPHDGSGLD